MKPSTMMIGLLLTAALAAAPVLAASNNGFGAFWRSVTGQQQASQPRAQPAQQTGQQPQSRTRHDEGIIYSNTGQQPAAQQFIRCPVTQLRTQATTRLPSPWWQTPQEGGLKNTRIEVIGGQATLVCGYWGYGTLISVMRKPPAGTHCTARRGGFTCSSR